MHAIRISKANWVGICSLLLTCIIAISWQCATPLHSDDFYYQRMPLNENGVVMWHSQGDYITSFSEIPEAAVNHWKTINGRLSNIAYLAVQPLPIWAIKLICGLMVAFFACMFWRWTGRKCFENQWMAIFVPLLFWTGMQWNDQMQSSDFQFNYTAPSILMLACLINFWQPERKLSWGAWAVLVLFSIWHECFTIMFGMFLGVQWLFNRRWSTLTAIAILIVGALFQYSPGTQERAVASTESATMQYYPWTLLASKAWVTLLAFALWIWRRKKLDPNVRQSIDRFGLGLVASWIAALALIATVGAPQRAHWANDVLAICMVLMIVKTLKPLRLRVWIWTTLLALYAAWGGSLIYWQIQVRNFTNYCIEEIKQGKTVVEDKNGFTQRQIPFWVMGMPKSQYGLYQDWMQVSLAYCNSNRKTKSFIVLPSDQIGTHYTDWPKVPGKNNLYFASPHGIIQPGNDAEHYNYFNAKITFGKPTINMAPLDYLISCIKGMGDTAQCNLCIKSGYAFDVYGDSIKHIFIGNIPRTLLGRPIIAIDVE